MNNIREIKNKLAAAFKEHNNEVIEEIIKNNEAITLINASIALLSKSELAKQAGELIGKLNAKLYTQDAELAKNMMRRFIWQMNEESGNIAWGVPYAFAYSLVYSEELAKTYHKIFLSYIQDIDADSNYVDFLALRLQVYEAIEIFLQNRIEYKDYAKKILFQAKKDLEASNFLAKIIKNLYTE